MPAMMSVLAILLASSLATGEVDPARVECGPKRVWHPDGCADRPRKRRARRPTYPVKAWDAGMEACVVLLVRVSKNGTAKVERVIKSTNPGWGFEEAAQRAVNKWRYKPATLNGEPVEASWPVFVDFLFGPRSICDTITELEGYP